MTNEEIIKEIKQGNKVQDNTYQLYTQNLPLLKHWSKLYSKVLEPEDLMQECYIALHKTVQSFDANSEYKFTTYLKKAVIWHLSNVTRVTSRVKLNTNDKMLLSQYIRLNRQEQNATGNNISLSKAAHLLHCSKKDIQRILQYMSILNCQSLDKPIESNSGDDMSLMDVIPADVDIEEDFEQQDCNSGLSEVWGFIDDICTDREADIITRHYKDNVTQKEIAVDCNISHQRVQQIERKGFRKLRNNERFRELARQNDYIDISYSYGYGSYKYNAASSVEYIADMRDRMHMWEQDNKAINVEKELERIEKHLQFINSGQAM